MDKSTGANPANPFYAAGDMRTGLLDVAAHIAAWLTDPTSFHIEMTATNTPCVQIFVHENETAAFELARRMRFNQEPVAVTSDNAHLVWTGVVYGVPVRMAALIDTEQWLRRTVDDFEELPEQGPAEEWS